jgi:hypothetical protein
MFFELRRTRILTERNSRFYTQPEIGRVNDKWLLPSMPMVPSEYANMAPSTRMLLDLKVREYAQLISYNVSR